jgi:hypothetical protein
MPRARGGLTECAGERAQGLAIHQAGNATEWDDAQEFLEETFLPALRQAVGGTNVTATRARFYRANTTIWPTVVELTYKGKRWEGTENGHWVDCHFLMMTFMPDGEGGWAFNPGSVCLFSLETQVC